MTAAASQGGGGGAPHEPVTVVQVAHHLDAVMDHTRVVVMHAGRVAQAGPPAELLQQANSPFARLVAAHAHQHQRHGHDPSQPTA